jgi:hypothetical protein
MNVHIYGWHTISYSLGGMETMYVFVESTYVIVASITVRHIYYQKIKYEVDLIDLKWQEGGSIMQAWKQKKINKFYLILY